MCEPRISIQRIINAQRMDPARKEIYVEGTKDLLFLKWLIGDNRDPHSLIRKIDTVDVPGPVDGGNRGRLIILASHLLGNVENARIFIDADFDRILGRDDYDPSIVWLTDGRDLESYYLREDCFNKFVSLSLCTETFLGSDLLTSLMSHCSKIGFLRLLSEINNLDLPFQQTKLYKHINFNKGNFTFNFNAYLRSLVGKSGKSRRIIPGLISNLDELIELRNNLENSEIIHGHDFICFIGEVLRTFGIDRKASDFVFRSTFEREFSTDYQSLSEIINYLC